MKTDSQFYHIEYSGRVPSRLAAVQKEAEFLGNVNVSSRR